MAERTAEEAARVYRREQLTPEHREMLAEIAGEVMSCEAAEDRLEVYLGFASHLAELPADAVIEQLTDKLECGGMPDANSRGAILTAIASERSALLGLGDDENVRQVCRLVEHAASELRMHQNIILAGSKSA